MTNVYGKQRPLFDWLIPGGQLVDVSTASVSYAPVPVQGVLVDAYCTISAAITGADSTVTVKKIASGVTSTLGTITVTQAASAAGSTFTMTITGTEENCTFNAGDTLVFDSDGASSTSSIANFLGVLRR